MKQLLALLILFFFVSSAQAATVYSSVATSSGVTNAREALGAPDAAYATFDAADSWIELGFAESTTDQVRVRLSFPTQAVVTVSAWLMEGSNITVAPSQNIGDGMSELVFNTDGATSLDRIRLFSSHASLGVDAAWITVADAEVPSSDQDADSLTDDEEATYGTSPTLMDTDNDQLMDAAEVHTYRTDPLDADSDNDGYLDGYEVLGNYDPNDATSAPDTFLSGDRNRAFPRLIKLVDDGDATTQHDTAVYVVDAEGKRRPFSNETIYFSWFRDFSEVEELNSDAMAAIPLGAAVPMHQGTWLVKIQSAADVYAVERGGVLRRIPDEATASYLYGPNWAARVRDVPPTDWPRYTLGSDLSLLHADDTIIRDNNLVVWHIRNGVKRQIPEFDLFYHGVQYEHLLPYNQFVPSDGVAEETLDSYLTGAMYNRASDFGWYQL